MSNEELAVLIAQGRDDLRPQLWEQVTPFIRQQARRTIRLTGGYGGVDADDLTQSGYEALLSAITSFDPDKGMSFIGWLELHLRTAFAEVGGYRAKHRDPLNDCASLDAPLPGGDDEADTTFLDTIADESDAYAEVEERLYNDELHEVLDKAIGCLPPHRAEIMRAAYWDGKTQAAIARERGISDQLVSAHIRRGLGELSRGRPARGLRAFLENETDYYAHVGKRAFGTTHTSAVEKMVLRRERLAEQWQHENEETG